MPMHRRHGSIGDAEVVRGVVIADGDHADKAESADACNGARVRRDAGDGGEAHAAGDLGH